ncbi:hypothetical protein P7K49_013658, partial [Saguinus oedipus]
MTIRQASGNLSFAGDALADGGYGAVASHLRKRSLRFLRRACARVHEELKRKWRRGIAPPGGERKWV